MLSLRFDNVHCQQVSCFPFLPSLGATCETETNECDSSPCQNGGACKDQLGGYTCLCVQGYRGDNCEHNLDECDSQPCQNGAKCVDGVNKYVCECRHGFTGKYSNAISVVINKPIFKILSVFHILKYFLCSSL